MDTSRHLGRVLALDPEARTARVQPGVVHAVLQKQAIAAGLRFGPDPSTHTRCTIGGMIGNNACGSRALGYGRTVDNVEALTVLLADGTVVSTSSTSGGHEPLDALVDEHLALVRTEFGRFGRQVSGYSFEHLLPENGRRFDRFLVGSEGTLGVVLEATVRLVEDAPARALAVLGYADMAQAADAVPGLLAHGLVACEGLGERIVSTLTHHPDLPAGGGWLFAEVTADSAAEAQALAEAVARDAGVPNRVVTDVAEQLALWRIREDGAGLAARSLERQAQSGWEDAAVPPEKLGDYLRDFDRLLREARLDGVPYGHFGDGCVHVRIDFELDDPDGRKRYREFVEDAADLVASYGGSMSGEHGDGRARSELLPRMYSPQAIALMEQAKRILDPDDLLNPGVLVAPAPFDADLRLAVPQRRTRTTLRLTHDDGSLAQAVHRCTGVGKCIADNTGAGGVMCPSYVATREEKDSTRGRARVLQDVVTGVLGFDDQAVDDAARPVPVVQGLRPRLPHGHRHGHLQVRGALAAVRAQAATALPLRARPAAALGADDPAAAGEHGAAQQDGRSDREGRPQVSTNVGVSLASRRSRSARLGGRAESRPPSLPTWTCGSGPTPSPTGSRPRPGARRSPCSRRWGCVRR